MSNLRSYINKNNTILSNSSVNTARNPIIELNFGDSENIIETNGFTRFIFDLDLDLLRSSLESGVISSGCTTGMTHTLKMTNSSFFDEDLINDYNPNQRRRASSFDLILFRIPKVSGSTGNSQTWDEGVGYDYNEFNLNKNSAFGGSNPLTYTEKRSFSQRPSNWFQRTTIDDWSEEGLYNNTNSGDVNYSGLTIIDRQHFSIGNENLEMDMTDEINGILNGTITGVTGWGIAYLPDVENITGLTESYSVSFFSRHTQTFYQPYLLTTYDDVIKDDRNMFLRNQQNKLYLYVYQNGDLINLDNNPVVQIEDRSGSVYNGLTNITSCLKTKGVYEVTIPNSFTASTTPCTYYDVWSNLSINGETIPNITNRFTLQEYSRGIQIGYRSNQSEKFGFKVYGILQNEKILSTDIRRVGVNVKKAYTSNQNMENVSLYYRIYVREGNTEVQVQDWSEINRTPNEYYFLFDCRDKIPNEYYVDLQVRNSGQIDTYKRELTFQIVNRK